MKLLILIIVVLVLFGGGGWSWRRFSPAAYPTWATPSLSITAIVVILLLIWLL
jgi:hypothetical protein